MAVRQKPRIPDDCLVYALTSARPPERLRACGVVLRTLSAGPISVVVGPALAERSIEDALRQQHAIVLELARRIDPILPARFGSRVAFEHLRAVLRASEDVVLHALEHVRGCQQMTVRLVGTPRASHGAPSPRSSGTAYLVSRRAAAHGPAEEAAPLERALNRFIVDTRVQPGRGGIRVTCFHLVPRDQVACYRIAFESAAPAVSPLKAVLTGPWPPFAFAPELPA